MSIAFVRGLETLKLIAIRAKDNNRMIDQS